MHSTAIIIPMFNEERGAEACVDALMQVVGRNKQTSLLIVNDGSSDRTPHILQKEKRRWRKKLIVVTHTQNEGYGAALQTGIQTANALGFSFVLFMDSDLTNDPADIPKFLAKMRRDVDCVKASRFSQGGSVVGVPFKRWIISRVGNLLASMCFRIGLSDCTNGFRLVRTKLLVDIHFHERKFAIILEELYELKKRHARFTAVPVMLTSRKTTASHFSYSLRTFFDYGKYAIKAALL